MAKIIDGTRYFNLVHKRSQVQVKGNRHSGTVVWTWPQGVPSCHVGYMQNSDGEDHDSIADLLDVVRTCQRLMMSGLACGQFRWRKTTVDDVWRLVIDDE